MIDYSKFEFRKGYDPNNKFHLKTEVDYKDESYTVSTVDLGMNHSFIEGVELYYETMIFKNSDMVIFQSPFQEAPHNSHLNQHIPEFPPEECYVQIVFLLYNLPVHLDI